LKQEVTKPEVAETNAADCKSKLHSLVHLFVCFSEVTDVTYCRIDL